MVGTTALACKGGYISIYFFKLLFVVALILLIIWLYKQIKGPQVTAQIETPLETLKMRYASGDIDTNEFEEKKKGLK